MLIETLIKTNEGEPDRNAARERKPNKEDKATPFSTLSDLTNRIEGHKLCWMIQRLTQHWGVSAGHLIQMHDGVMVPMDNLNPNGHAAKEMKTHIDKEILQDLAYYTRQQLNCWI